MQEVKTPKKPLIFYYLIVMAVLSAVLVIARIVLLMKTLYA